MTISGQGYNYQMDTEQNNVKQEVGPDVAVFFLF